MDVLTGVFDFGMHSGSGPRTMSQTFTFDRRVTQASAVLSGYTAAFSNADHELGRLIVTLNTEIASSGGEVTVTSAFGLRDFSGTWDDDYEGQVRFCLLVETDRRRVPPLGGLPPASAPEV